MIEVVRREPSEGYRVTVTVRHSGKLFEVEKGQNVELFPISVLAEVVERGPSVIRKWEAEGKFPKPLYVIASRPGVRFYSAQQIVAINNLYRANAMTRNGRGSAKISVDEFLRRCTAVFFDHHAVVDVETGVATTVGGKVVPWESARAA